jgi:hypothetical protein
VLATNGLGRRCGPMYPLLLRELCAAAPAPTASLQSSTIQIVSENFPN